MNIFGVENGMQYMTWYQAIFIVVPQTFLMAQIGLRLFNIKTRLSGTFLSATLAGLLSCYILCCVRVNYVIYFLILFLSMSALIAYIEKINFLYTIIGMMMGFIVYAVFKTLSLMFVIKAFTVASKQWLGNPAVQLRAFYLTAVVLVVLLAVIIKKKIILYDLDKNRVDEDEKDF
ncbi:MAG: hypothetical protein LBK69_05690 [Syntrophomonadaceae bacterium]|jgi:hypothetical protein|nr:hypothetical protein [Syntrophomonadaceae bacterium]